MNKKYITKHQFLKNFISQIWHTSKCSGTVFANLAWYWRTNDLVPFFYTKVHLFENSLLIFLAQLYWMKTLFEYSFRNAWKFKNVRKKTDFYIFRFKPWPITYFFYNICHIMMHLFTKYSRNCRNTLFLESSIQGSYNTGFDPTPSLICFERFHWYITRSRWRRGVETQMCVKIPVCLYMPFAFAVFLENNRNIQDIYWFKIVLLNMYDIMYVHI